MATILERHAPIWGSRPELARAVLLCAAAIGCGFLVTVNGIAAGLPAGIVLLIGLVVLRPRQAANVTVIAPPFRWIPYAWVGLLLVSGLSFTSRSPLEAASGSASAENVLELFIYGLIALFIWSRWNYTAHLNPVRPRAAPFLLLPCAAIASTMWSTIPIFTLARALQLLVPIALAVLVARLWVRAPVEGELIFRATLRIFVQITTLLTLIGFAVPIWANDRFTWPGAHTGMAALFLAFSLLILIIGGTELTKFSGVGYGGRIVLFSAALLLSQTRTVLAGTLLGIVTVLWLAGRRRPAFRYFGILYIVLLGVVFVGFAQEELFTYVERGGGVEELRTLNGRIPLWTLAFEEMGTPRLQVLGYGFGAARVILFPKVSWAGDAHNTWIELFLGLGAVGVLVGLVALVFVGNAVIRLSLRDPSRIHLLAAAVFVMLALGTVTGAGLSQPGVEFSLLTLVLAVGLKGRAPPLQLDGNGVAEARRNFLSRS
jgi:hypothetical protein